MNIRMDMNRLMRKFEYRLDTGITIIFTPYHGLGNSPINSGWPASSLVKRVFRGQTTNKIYVLMVCMRYRQPINYLPKSFCYLSKMAQIKYQKQDNLVNQDSDYSLAPGRS